jgi:hypothetical protein
MNARTQVTMDFEMQRRAQAKAAELGISFAEYIRRVVGADLGEPKPKFDVSAIFGLIKDGPETDIGRQKHKMIGEAVWQEHLRKTGQLHSGARRRRAKRDG